MNVCKDIGRAYHRTETESRVSNIVAILTRLADVMTNVQKASLTPAMQVNEARQMSTPKDYMSVLVAQALQIVERDGGKCHFLSFCFVAIELGKT